MASKYAPLSDHLRTLQTGAWQASFAEIEGVLRADLPASARRHPAWWSNGGHSHSGAWMDAGFEVCKLDIPRQTVLFRRTGTVDSEETPRQKRTAHAGKRTERPPARQQIPQGTTTLTLGGHDFEWIAEIAPDAAPNGEPLEYMPQERYAKAKEKPLNKHGYGPFCRFSIPGLPTRPGLYAVTVARRLVYVGIAKKNLRQRWGASGYAEIQPVNCFRGGQPTNCRINHAILLAVREKQAVELWIRHESNPRPLEALLIRELNPPWNDQR